MLDTLTRSTDHLLAWMSHGSLWLARLGGLLILASVVMVAIEVVSRGIWGRSLGASTELSGYFLAISSSWSFAYALFRKAHIRIDVLSVRLPLTVRSVLDLLALAALALFGVLAVSAATGIAAASFSAGALSNTSLLTPLWIPQWLWAGGLIWFSVAVAVLLLRVVLALVNAEPAEVQRVAGSLTLDDQTEAEILLQERT